MKTPNVVACIHFPPKELTREILCLHLHTKEHHNVRSTPSEHLERQQPKCTGAPSYLDTTRTGRHPAALPSLNPVPAFIIPSGAIGRRVAAHGNIPDNSFGRRHLGTITVTSYRRYEPSVGLPVLIVRALCLHTGGCVTVGSVLQSQGSQHIVVKI